MLKNSMLIFIQLLGVKHNTSNVDIYAEWDRVLFVYVRLYLRLMSTCAVTRAMTRKQGIEADHV